MKREKDRENSINNGRKKGSDQRGLFKADNDDDDDDDSRYNIYRTDRDIMLRTISTYFIES